MSRETPVATPYPLFDPERDVSEIPVEFLLNYVPKPLPPEAGPEEIAKAQRLFAETFRSQTRERTIPGYPTAWDNENLIIQVCKDYRVANKNQVAYILATAKHETATFNTLQEYGCSNSQACYDAYGNPINGCTPLSWTDRPYGKCDPTKRYYGRGYVQLTWRSNYQKYTDITGRDLIGDPDILIREPSLSAWIMVDGMMNGRFTGAKLPTYVNDTTVDFYNARRTVNGTQAADTVKAYAQAYQQDSRVINYSLNGTNLCGNVGGRTLTTGTYNLTCDIYVNSGASLHIMPGVTLNYNGHSFTVNGQLTWGP